MREILFRGKRLDNGELVEGDLVRSYLKMGNACITDFAKGSVFGVDNATVGQYTGLKDKNGKRIFEGDILTSHDFDEEDGYGVVQWFDGAWEVSNDQWCGTFRDNYNGFEFEIIGNIHDNPELVKGGEGNY